MKENNTVSEVPESCLQVNPDRIAQHVAQLAVFGANRRGGIDRPFGSRAEREARAFLQKLWRSELGVATRVDGIANLWSTLPGSERIAPIVLGSHHDTVSNGGAYDGAIGVLLATEVLRTIQENDLRLRHPLTVLSFTGEEPNSYGVSTMGSKTVSGKIRQADLMQLTSMTDHSSLKEAVALAGGDLEQAEASRLHGGEIAAFIECHIEQGRRLYDKGLSLGIVTRITGIYREKVKVVGDANHAGTTIMSDRKDALVAAAEFILAFEAYIRSQHQDEVVGTVGVLEVDPNSANIIPGEVELTLEFRTAETEYADKIRRELDKIERQVVAARQVKITRQVILDQAMVAMDGKIIEVLSRSLQTLAEPYLKLTSMAGHDAAHLVNFTKTGMLFVQSIDGKSHCPGEKTDLADIVKAGNALLQAVLILDKELN